MSRIREIIALVVEDLAARDFGRPINVAAKKLARYKLRTSKDSDLPGLEKLQCFVSPASRTPTDIARGIVQKDFGLVVGFMQAVPTIGKEWDDAEVDRLIDLVEDVEDYLASNARLPGLKTARYYDAKTEPVFDPEQLQSRHMFVSAIQLVVRQAPV